MHLSVPILSLLLVCASARFSTFYADQLLKSCGKHAFMHQYRQTRAIFNGRNVAKGEFPAQVESKYFSEARNLSHMCGGTLVSPWHVITAAHCHTHFNRTTQEWQIANNFYVAFGSLCTDICDNDDTPKHRRVKQMIYPATYNGTNLDNDIVILVLEKKVSESHACLYDEEPLQDSLDVVGWGRTRNFNVWDETGDSKNLRTASVRVAKLRDRVINTFPKPSDACTGDSGGGLYQTTVDGRRQLVGIVSGGERGCKGVAGEFRREYLPAYTRVSFFHDWICYWTGICQSDRPAESISVNEIPASIIWKASEIYTLPAPEGMQL